MNLGDIMLCKTSQAKTVLCGFTYMWNLRQNKTKSHTLFTLLEVKSRMVVARAGDEENGEIGSNYTNFQL